MRVLYLGRGELPTSVLKLWARRLRSKLYFSDQDGFFESSLYGAVEVTSITFNDNIKKHAKDADILLVNWKQPGFGSEEARFAAIQKVVIEANLPSVLFINAAQAQYLPKEYVLDAFEVVFKREPFIDRNLYDISDENKAKIVPTMIHCPFVHSPRNNWLSKTYHLVRPKVSVCSPEEAMYEVGFSGADAAEHSLRRDAWQRVVDEGFSRIGGLQSNPVTKESIPEALHGPRYKGRAYRDSLCAAKVNLALDGIGQYTFRHQELLYLGAFMMSGPSIRELELPMPLEEGKHYVAFDDMDDMVEKIRYYLAHEDERLQIAADGKALFDEYYDPVRHGQELVAALEKII